MKSHNTRAQKKKLECVNRKSISFNFYMKCSANQNAYKFQLTGRLPNAEKSQPIDPKVYDQKHKK